MSFGVVLVPCGYLENVVVRHCCLLFSPGVQLGGVRGAIEIPVCCLFKESRYDK